MLFIFTMLQGKCTESFNEISESYVYLKNEFQLQVGVTLKGAAYRRTCAFVSV
jgi:hypothetical protein